MSAIPGSSKKEAVSPVHRIFYTSQSDIIRLGRRIGAGAEGEVYEIQDKSGLVAKVYHHQPPAEKAEKLVALSNFGNDRLFNLSAWPVTTLLDAPDGQIIGFVMKKISQAEEVHALHSPKSRLQKFPEASWAFLIYVAANIARAVAAIHEHGMVIGDLNPKNILITRKATVYFLDVDSFQMSVAGKIYRCEGGFPEYTPPELQGLAFRDLDRTQEHDCFGLAVVIFQLLFMGRHPFSGRYLGAGEMPLERAIRERRFAYGAGAESRAIRQPPGALALDAMPPALVDLFERAFLSSDRPQPVEWIEPLCELADALKKCDSHDGHYYYRELQDCPWCGIETRARVRLFNIPLPGDDSKRGHFHLDEIWKEIESVSMQDASLIQWGEILKAPKPSTEVAAFARNRRIYFILLLILSAFGGLVIPLLVGVQAATYFLITFLIFMLLADEVGGQLSRLIGRETLVERIRERSQQAEKAVCAIQEKYNLKAEEWDAKRYELSNLKEAYEKNEQYRIQQLEKRAQSGKESTLNEFLAQFKIDDANISGISEPVKKVLLSKGIATAANLGENIKKIRRIRDISFAQAKRLREWRRGLEQIFDSNPASGSASGDGKLRHRLDRELSGLSRMKKEIDALGRNLQLAVQELAQDEKDLEVASKSNSSVFSLLLLALAFFIGLMIYGRFFH